VIVVIGILSAFILVGVSSITNSANIAKGKVFADSLRNSLSTNSVSQWNFDSLTTASNGTSIPDSWGNILGTLFTNNGTANKIITDQSGCVSGNCISLDGDSDYISFLTNDNFNINSTDSFTMSIWAKSIESTTSAIITKGRWNTGTAGWILRNASSPEDLYFVFDDGGTNHRERRLYTGRTFNWKNFVLTINLTRYIIYINGAIKYNLVRDFNNTSNINDLVIGSDSSKAYCFLNGIIDEIRIYNGDVVSSQIQENYYISINKLFKNKGISKIELNQRLTELKSNLATHE